MKLIIKQYLASLKERDELDAIMPDLLSQLGLNVISAPRRGTRQNGVDVAAIGSLDGSEEKVYLFSIKAGDLSRTAWDGSSPQSLRPSLNEIIDSYIPNRVPPEHKSKPIVICICIGGDVLEQVRQSLTGYINNAETTRISFEEWNGDKIAEYILSSFLREDLFTEQYRSLFRKALALIDEPEASTQNFYQLIRKTFAEADMDKGKSLTAMRQILICLWALFSWARDQGNLESAYLSSERALLYAWDATKNYIEGKTKQDIAIVDAFNATLAVYINIAQHFLAKCILPHVRKRYGISMSVKGSCYLDINLKLFDMLGRLSICGIWEAWRLGILKENNVEKIDQNETVINNISKAILDFIYHNPALLLPIKDNQTIDIALAIFLLFVSNNNEEYILKALKEMVNRAEVAYGIKNNYPCILTSYNELLEHPVSDDNSYFKEVTGGSILFPMLALFAVLSGENDSYQKIQNIKEKILKHCNFQIWYPDEHSEENYYRYNNSHGATLSDVCIEKSMDEFKNQVFGECDNMLDIKTLSAFKYGVWPIILVASRHHRFPLPVGVFKELFHDQIASLA